MSIRKRTPKLASILGTSICNRKRRRSGPPDGDDEVASLTSEFTDGYGYSRRGEHIISSRSFRHRFGGKTLLVSPDRCHRIEDVAG